LVLGLGNLLLRDDGAGLRLLEELRRDPRCAYADFVDGGTQGIALLGTLAGCSAVILLDAVSLGAPPGTVHVLRGPMLEALPARRAGTAHEGNALELLAVARLLGEEPEEVIVIGIEPAEIRTGIGLSETVEYALPEALARVREILGELKRRQDVSGSAGANYRRTAN
jgi:hydrogenase maturation protease